MPSAGRPIRDANERLWAALRLGKAGIRFRRRAALGPLVVDFYCPALKLVVEIDASGDRRAELAAEQRDQWLWRHGYAVLRLDRGEVMQRRERVLAMIGRRGEGDGRLSALGEAQTPYPSSAANSASTCS